jgi:ATP-dependent Clp protease ATP-binding subunit ClpA
MQFPRKAFMMLNSCIARAKKLDSKAKRTKVTVKHVHQTVRRDTGLPDFLIRPETIVDVGEMKDYFRERIFSQDPAIEALIASILSFKQRINDPTQPVGSFFFVGPSGVGKTELAKVLAEFIFGSKDKTMIYPMSRYQGLDGVASLFGRRGRTVEEMGKLVGDVRTSPFSVVLFDEIDQASPMVINSLYDVLGEGRLTDPLGREVHFTGCVIILSTNVGMERYFSHGAIGFPLSGDSRTEYCGIDGETYDRIRGDLEDLFKTPFLNRVHKIIPFLPLDPGTVRKIAHKTIEEACTRAGLAEPNIRLDIDEKTVNLLVDRGYDREYGARPMQKAVKEYVLFPVAEYLNNHPGLGDTTLKVRLNRGRVCVN